MRACDHCGVQYQPIRKDQRFCCPEHQVVYHHRLYRQKLRAERGTCEYCGEYCSSLCSEAQRWKRLKYTAVPLRWVACVGCHRVWNERGVGTPRCESCFPIHRRVHAGPSRRVKLSRQPRHFVAGYCSSCGVDYVAYACRHRTEHSYCADCQPKRWKSDLERARRYGVAYEPVNRRRVFERDGYVCQICGDETQPDDPYNSLKAPTLDHIVPVSAGGSHTYDNVQCACRDCNARKGDGRSVSVGQQMALV